MFFSMRSLRLRPKQSVISSRSKVSHITAIDTKTVVTPTSIRNEAKTRPWKLNGWTSPYPTVVKVMRLIYKLSKSVQPSTHMKPTVPISNVALSDAAIRRNLLREGCTGRDYTITGTSPIEQKGGRNGLKSYSLPTLDQYGGPTLVTRST